MQALCERIGIMDHGRLQACDTLPRLLLHLRGLIRFRPACLTPALRERIKAIPDTSLAERGRTLELECADVKAALLRLVSALNEAHADLVSLEIEEPNLERVFLHLTGRELRD